MPPCLSAIFLTHKSVFKDLQLWILNMLNLHVVYSLTKELAFCMTVLGRVRSQKSVLVLSHMKLLTSTKKVSVKLKTEALLTLRSLRSIS